MTNDNQDLTDEQIAVRTLSLESYLGAAGLNEIRKKRAFYGDAFYDAAESISDPILESNEAQEVRKRIREQEEAQRKQMGYAGPTYGPSEDKVEFEMYSTTRTSLGIAKLGDLEKLVKDNGATLKDEVPEELKNLSYMEIITKAKETGALSEDGKLDLSKLDKKYQDALDAHKALIRAYDISAARKIGEKIDFYSEPNALLSQVANEYKPKNGTPAGQGSQ